MSENRERYRSYSSYFKELFGGRVQKVTIDAGFSCPNRDGTVASGGCTYCNNNAFNPSYCVPEKSVLQQIEEGMEFHANRYRRANNYLAYFQAFSNTHASLEDLKRIYEPAINHPKICGLVIGTRPDCMDEEKLAYFANIAKSKYVIIEYGVESVYEETLLRINRGHTYQKAEEIIKLTHQFGIHIGAHLIFGLPGETREMMMESAKIISKLPLNTIKFHQLQIVKETQMAFDYQQNPSQFTLFTLEEYLDFIVNYISYLNPKFVIERFAGEVPPRFLISEPWGNLRYDQVLIQIQNKFEKLDLWQGKFLNIIP
ncbi:MAG: TIGR01212 family radical SAM protein [Bacteroidota bacterium]